MARILIVDDVAQIRSYLAAVLKPGGHECLEAANGQEGLDVARKEDIDLVISDGLMPVMDGFRLCLELKRDEKTADIPFIFYTASFTHPEDEQLAGRLGADAYLLKPAEPKVIREAVESVLAAPHAEGNVVATEAALASLLDQYSGRIESKLDTKVVQLKQTEEARDVFRSLLDNLPLVIATLDVDGRLDFYNRLTADFLRMDPSADAAETIGRIKSAFFAEDLASVTAAVRDVLGDPRPLEHAIRVRRHDGQVRKLKLSLTPYRGPEGELLGIVAAGLDVTEQEQHNELLRYLSEHDLLTGLPNRRVLDVRFEEVLERIGQGGQSALLFIDIDRFKSVNDEYGHDIGDAALQGVARVIREQVRGNDLLVRLCGDEFVVLCGDADAEVARRVSERIRGAVASATLVPGAPERRLTVSIGLNLLPEPSTPGFALQQADEAMYRAKGAGRNRTEQVSEDATPDDMDSIIERAMADPRPLMMYAPVYSLGDGRILWCEARPQFEFLGGAVTEDELLSVATGKGYAPRITKRVMERALEEMSGLDVRCSVRLSVTDILDPGIFETAERLARERGVDPSRLMFSIPFRHMLGGGLTETWLQSASRHSIRLLLDAGDADIGAVLNAPLTAFSEIELSAWSISMDEGGPRPESRSLFQHLVAEGGACTLMGLDTSELVQVARELGACCGQGIALSPLVSTLQSAPKRVDLE